MAGGGWAAERPRASVILVVGPSIVIHAVRQRGVQEACRSDSKGPRLHHRDGLRAWGRAAAEGGGWAAGRQGCGMRDSDRSQRRVRHALHNDGRGSGAGSPPTSARAPPDASSSSRATAVSLRPMATRCTDIDDHAVTKEAGEAPLPPPSAFALNEAPRPRIAALSAWAGFNTAPPMEQTHSSRDEG